VPIRTGLAGAVVQRSLADGPVVLAAWLLLVFATTLLATGVVYGDAVASGGLRRALLAAPPQGRAIDVTLAADPDAIDGLDRSIRPEIQRAMATAGGDVVRVVRSGSFADRATPAGAVQDLTLFESFEGIEDRATLASGAWPQAGGDPVEATLSDVAAREMGLAVGDRIELVSRDDRSLTQAVVISGIWVVDPGDAAFLGDPLVTTGSTTAGTYTTRGPLVVRESDLLTLGGRPARVEVSWRGLLSIPNLRVDGVDALRNGTADLAAHLRVTVRADANPRVTSGLPALLDDVGRSVLVSRSGIMLLTIQFAVLAGYAVVLVAGMLVERRRAEIALMRSRGGSSVHLVAMAGIEAAILAVPAAVLAPLLALGVVGVLDLVGPTAGLDLADSATIGQNAIVVSVLAGLVSIAVLTVPTLAVSASPAGARAATGRQARTTLPQRLGLDLALVAVAAVALWQLRLYGAPLTRNVRGTLGLDPLLVAAPAIGLVAGAILALRVVPRAAELGERLLIRGRGLVGSLGGRQLARRPLRYSRAALLLMLASALGTLAAAHAATWSRSQSDQAAYQAVADVRAIADDYSLLPTWAAGPRYRAIPGVTSATPIAVAPLDVGRTVRDGTLVGLDPRATGAGATGSGSGSDSRADSGADSGAGGVLAPLAGTDLLATPVAVAATARRLAITIDAAFQADPAVGGGTIRRDAGGLSVSAVVRDGDGRLFRTSTATGAVDRAGQRLIVNVLGDATSDLGPSSPLAIVAIELAIDAVDPISIFGSAELVGVETSDAVAGDADWQSLAVSSTLPGWAWSNIENGTEAPFTASPDAPNRISVGSARPIQGGFGGPASLFRLYAAPPPDAAVPVIASRSFLDATGAAVGDEIGVSSRGLPIRVRIAGWTDGFAPYDPAEPLLIADLGALDSIRYLATGRTAQADEWLLTVEPGNEAAVLAALREPGAGTSQVIGRLELTRLLSTDPVPLGLIGVLGLGSVAALLFAGIGFLVSSTISTSERIGEFALLRALGLSNGQLALWLSIESVFLLVVGLGVGSALGLVLAWLVLPFATLTQTGLAPLPAPVVLVPWEAIVPAYLGAVVLFVLSLWIVRRQLPDIEISGVLRARSS
jgi:hypothetical protein